MVVFRCAFPLLVEVVVEGQRLPISRPNADGSPTRQRVPAGIPDEPCYSVSSERSSSECQHAGDVEQPLLTSGSPAAMNRLPRESGRTGNSLAGKASGVMWTKAVLVLAFVAVVVPMALLLGVQLGFAWAQHAVLP